MNENKIDMKKVAELSLQISHNCKKIAKLFPTGNDIILKELAAAAIHITFFMRDVYEIIDGERFARNETEESKFYNECGCANEIKSNDMD